MEPFTPEQLEWLKNNIRLQLDITSNYIDCSEGWRDCKKVSLMIAGETVDYITFE